MSRSTKTFSVSLPLPIASVLEHSASKGGLSPGLKVAEIVESYFLDEDNLDLAADAKSDLLLLRELRNDAIEKSLEILGRDGFRPDITLQTFQACQRDAGWLERYEKYIRGNAIVPGNPRKANANQTIGSRIKSQLRADDLLDASGKPQRGRAPAGTIIQTYQFLRQIDDSPAALPSAG